MKKKRLEIKPEEKREIATVDVPMKLFRKYAAVVAVIKRHFDDADPDQVDDWSLDLASEMIIELGVEVKNPCFSELSNELADDLYRGDYRHSVTAIVWV